MGLQCSAGNVDLGTSPLIQKLCLDFLPPQKFPQYTIWAIEVENNEMLTSFSPLIIIVGQVVVENIRGRIIALY